MLLLMESHFRFFVCIGAISRGGDDTPGGDPAD